MFIIFDYFIAMENKNLTIDLTSVVVERSFGRRDNETTRGPGEHRHTDRARVTAASSPPPSPRHAPIAPSEAHTAGGTSSVRAAACTQFIVFKNINNSDKYAFNIFIPQTSSCPNSNN